MQHRDNCDRVLKPHVLHDPVAKKYRGQLRCGCGVDSALATDLREQWSEADADVLGLAKGKTQ